MKKITLFLGIMFLFQSSLFARISVAPQYVLFDANTKTRAQTVNISNGSNEEKTYRVKLLHYRQNEKGEYEEVITSDENNWFADDLIYYGPRKFTLKPTESQVVRIQRKALTDKPDGEYRSHILFQEVENPKAATKAAPDAQKAKGLSFEITAIYGISIPIIVRKGNLYAEANLTNISKMKNKEGNPALKVDIIRKGTKSLRGDLYIKDGSKTIGMLKGINVFLTTGKRTMEVVLYENVNEGKVINDAKLKGKKLTIEYIGEEDKKLSSAQFTY